MDQERNNKDTVNHFNYVHTGHPHEWTQKEYSELPVCAKCGYIATVKEAELLKSNQLIQEVQSNPGE